MKMKVTLTFIVISCLSPFSEGWSPSIKRCPDTDVVHDGDTVKWTCDASDHIGTDEIDSYQWYKSQSANRGYKSLHGETTATLSPSVSTYDTRSWYTCSVSYASNRKSQKSPPKWLIVKDTNECNDPPGKPSLVFYPSGTINVGDYLFMVCHPDSNGGTPASYEWYECGGKYEKTSSNFRYRRTTLNDNGIRHSCRARTSNGCFSPFSSSKTLTVKDPPSRPVITGWPDKAVNVGDRLTVYCAASTAGGTNITYRWYKAGDSSPQHKGPRYTIDTIAKGHAGRYKCKATTDGITKTTSTEKTLSVKDGRPDSPGINLVSGSSLYVGEILSLTCTSSKGGQPTSYKWYKGAGELKGSNKREYKKSVTLDDGGEYRCQAVNEDGATFSAIEDIVVWEEKCTKWTKWLIDSSDTSLERRYKSCGEISSRGEIDNWDFESEPRPRKVSTIDASFRSKKTFTETLRDKKSEDFKKLSGEFLPLLKKAYGKGDVGKKVKDIIITHFTEGSVIVHYKLVLTGTFNATDPLVSPEKVSKTLDNYLGANPNEAKKYGVDPSSEKRSGGSNAGQQSNQANLVLGVTLTIIFFLVITIVVLVVFLMRLRRQLPKPASADGSVGFQARNGGVTMHGSQARESDPYACLGDPDMYNDAFYQGLSEQQRIARAREGGRGQMNAAYDADDDYAYMTEEEVNAAARDVQGGLEDGYRVNQGDPMYHVLEHEADQGAPEGTDAVYALEDQVTATQEDPVYSLADNDNSDDYALPPKKKHGGVPLHSLAKKTKPEVKKKGLAYPPPQVGESEAVYSLEVKPDVRKRQQYDNTDDYSTPYAHAPGAGYPDENKMVAKGGPENAMEDSADDYSTPFVHAPGAGYPGDNKMAAKGCPRNATAKIADDYSTPYALSPGSKTPDDSRMAARGGQGNDTVDNDEEYSRLQLPKLTDPKTMKNLGKGQKPANVVKAPAPDVDEDDDDNDYYDYGLACDVVVP